MRALVVAPQPFFSPRGTPLSVYYRTLVTAELGVEIDLLTYGEGRDVVIPGVRIVRIPRIRFLEPVRIGPSFAKLTLDVLVFCWAVVLAAVNRYDFVHAHEEAVFFCRHFKKIFGCKLVYDMHSSLPQQLINFAFTKSRLVLSLFRYLERKSLKASDAVLTICPALAQQATSSCQPERHFLIENSIFEEVRLRESPRSKASTDLSHIPHDRPLVAYIGSFEPYQGLDLLLKSFPAVRKRIPRALLLMVGGSRRQVADMREQARRLGIEDACIIMGRVAPSEVNGLLARVSVLVSSRSTGTNTPLKIYQLLASSIPLVATRVPSHTQILDDEICFLVEPDPKSMAKGLVQALTDKSRRRRVVRKAGEFYRRHYSRSAYRAKVKDLLNHLGRRPRASEVQPETGAPYQLPVETGDIRAG